jgi:Leucine-rich repeat (LRR) protein
MSRLKISSLHGLEKVAGKVGRIIIELNLSHNEIEKIWAKHFQFYFSMLRRLDLSYNKIIFLQSGCFDALLALVFLDLGHNMIFYLPPIFSFLLKLERLDLSDNKLTELKKPVLPKLKMINLADNPL